MKKKLWETKPTKNSKRIARQEVRNLGANVLGQVRKRRSKKRGPDSKSPPFNHP